MDYSFIPEENTLAAPYVVSVVSYCVLSSPGGTKPDTLFITIIPERASRIATASARAVWRQEGPVIIQAEYNPLPHIGITTPRLREFINELGARLELPHD